MTLKLGQFKKPKKYGDTVHTHYRFDESIARNLHKEMIAEKRKNKKKRAQRKEC